MLEVTFRYSEDDLQALVRQYPFYVRYETLLWTFVFLLLGMAAGSILPVLLGFWSALAVCWAIFIFLVLFVLYRLAIQRPASTIDLSLLHPITMRLEQSYWQTSNLFIQSRDDWSKLSRVVLTNEHLFVFVKDGNAFAITRDAFPSDEAAERFATFADERIRSAVSPREQIVPNWQISQPDLVEQDLAVDIVRGWFTPTIEELEVHEFKPPSTKEWAKSLAAIFACIGIVVLVFNGAGYDAAWYLLCAAAGMISLVLAVIVSYSHQRRVWKRKLPIYRLQLTQLAASPRGISLMSATNECHIDWRAYTELKQNAQMLILEGRPPNIDQLAVPRRAFQSDEDISRFVSLANAYMKRGDDEVPSATISATPEKGNPY